MQLKRPFLKWAGGKTRLVAAIRELAPAGPKRLIEPFAGSAALALNFDAPHVVLADTNSDLIAVFAALQREPEAFIARCRTLFVPENNRAAAYYALRAAFNAATDIAERASLFVYLNRHGYNGLCRYNHSGGFNVPFGRYAAPRLPEREMLAFAALLQRCTLESVDFRVILARATEGDLVYCDPPYVPASATARFTAYARGGFTSLDQIELAESCRAAARRGACVIVSNHDTPETRHLYADATEQRTLSVRRQISCHAFNRQPARELLAVYRPGLPPRGAEVSAA